MYDPRWGDPRDRDDDPRDIEIHWIELGRGADPRRTTRVPARRTSGNEIAMPVNGTTIRAMCSCGILICHGDSNARS